MGRFIHILFFVSLCLTLRAQDIELAKEYLLKEDYEKARYHYELALKKKSWPKDVYPGYPQTLVRLNDLPTADKYFKKLIKSEDDNSFFKIDYLLFLKSTKNKEYEKVADKTAKELLALDDKFPSFLLYFNNKREYELLEKWVVAYRKAKLQPTAFYRELAEAKKAQGNSREMSEELLLGFLADDEPLENLKNVLQGYLTEPADLTHFQTLLLEVNQSDPQNLTVSELLLWIFVQQRDFTSAFIHAKALDKRMRLQGEKQKEIGDLAFDNKDYDAALRIYESVIKDYPKTSTFYYARGKYISAKEQKVKSRFPTDLTELKSLIRDYKQLIAESAQTNSSNTYKYQADMALLYGFYLNSLDSSIFLMNEAVKQSQFDKRFQAQARLHLGDLYLLDNQPWESTLLYSQVESMEKEQPLGHEAKLRNAKLHYYHGDFQLAQEQMDVLKLATSREISNDAIQLSVLIQDNLVEDTTGYALKKFAAIELLMFQNKWEQANKELDELYGEYRAASLKDDILYLEAKIARQFGDYPKAIQKLTLLLENHKEDILADDAVYQLALLYDYQLRDKTKAMEYYNKLLTGYPSSIFVVESRKRFRDLRGDKLN